MSIDLHVMMVACRPEVIFTIQIKCNSNIRQLYLLVYYCKITN